VGDGPAGGDRWCRQTGGIVPRRLYPRHRLDASPADALYALGAAALARRMSAGPSADGGLVCLSVRSAFDLLLTALDLAPGDEVLVSAVTHPDMVRILRLHRLVPVPVDLDPATLAVDPVAMGEAVTARTRAVVFAHLFGARVDLGDVVAFAGRHDLLVIEDCAQSVEGPEDRGDPGADVSLFSFGFIKTATAFGGAIAHVRDPDLARAMVAVHDRWPVQARREYAAKVLKAVAVLALSRPRVYGLVVRAWPDPGVLIRTIPAGDDARFTRWLRRRPSPALGAVLERRLRRFPTERLQRRAAAGDELAAALPPDLLRPSAGVSRTTHWLLPVVTSRPQRLIDGLRAAGFEASQGASQIAAVPPAPPCARSVMAGIVFLPAYPEMPASARRRLARRVRDLTADEQLTAR
jgi:perosamine synthetase